MAQIRMRYVVAHRKRGRVYWYWQRKGFPLTRLPDDERGRYLKQIELNAAADRTARTPRQEAANSVRSMIRVYEQSERYSALAKGTKLYYDKEIVWLLRLFGDLPIEALTRQVVVEYVTGLSSIKRKRAAAAVLSCLFDQAMYRGILSQNPALRLRLQRGRRRADVWADEEVSIAVDACDKRGLEPVATWITLLQYTAQRSNDAATMTWKQYDGAAIQLVQQKTGKLVWVPCHRRLRARLDALPRNSVQIAPGGVTWLGDRFREVRKDLGLMHLQPRDLRRTAMVRMSEAGATTQYIAAVSGHSINATEQILETYVPRTKAMASGAIDLWERAESRTKR